MSKKTIANLQKNNIFALFPIQVQTFDHIYDGKDVIGQARTGSGKTISFALPIIEKMLLNPPTGRGRPPIALIMAPTRELAKQIEKEIGMIAEGSTISACCIYGGASYDNQEYAMKHGVDIIVGTPGRITDHIHRGNLNLKHLKYVVLDEADRMLEVGFAEAVDEILGTLYEQELQPQTLLFSATMPKWVKDTAKKYLKKDKVVVNLIGDDSVKTSETIQHFAIKCPFSERASTVGDVVQVYSGAHGRTIIFTSTKKECSELSLHPSVKQDAQALHGDINQKQRELTLQSFREGNVRCLVATDVAARGLDIPEVDLVIQTEVPEKVEDYIHRAGRTGRAGKSGVCILFYKPREEYLLKNIEAKTGIIFKKIGAPQPEDIVRSSAKDAIKFLDKIPESILEYFRPAAEQLIKDKGAVDALSAALAQISGNTEGIKKRSLLSSSEGYVTCMIEVPYEIRGLGYIWSIIARILSPEDKDNIRGMRFRKDHLAALFDVPENLVQQLQDKWTERDKTLSFPSTLPELDEPREMDPPPRSTQGRRYGSGGYGGGGYGGNSRGSNGRGSFGRGGNGGFGSRRR